MTEPRAEIKDSVRTYIAREFLGGDDPGSLSDSTPLLSAGVLDSMATLKLVSFLEDTYGIEFTPSDIDPEHMESLEAIAALVDSKRRQAGVG
jgi:acyl carrier protein